MGGVAADKGPGGGGGVMMVAATAIILLIIEAGTPVMPETRPAQHQSVSILHIEWVSCVSDNKACMELIEYFKSTFRSFLK